MSSEEKETGRSMVRMERTWSKSMMEQETRQLHVELQKGKKRKRTVLHDITNDTEFIKVSTTSFSSERFLESDLNVRYEVLVESGIEHNVGESKNEQVLDHLFSEVVIDTEDLTMQRSFVSTVLMVRSRIFDNVPPLLSTPSSNPLASPSNSPNPFRMASRQ